ncbi:glycosyltransferase [Fulvivirga lutea]|uniref:Glycosyltransferase n=1 Tax=Fulvivirga lutea TaxID=2810512 RepID=A0A974WDC7_9BACT|nr:glycosyltransferase [Fulvivirga lutea]QSE95909.1 glycosyltransferase [Fulvivirga lutea]
MRFYSVIIPIYNRPQEIDELLESLTKQTYTNFEVLVIEDGSSKKCEHIVQKYADKLDVQYYFKENSGQGFSRNFGFEKAKGNYFIVFDSDCLIPEHYFQAVEDYLTEHKVDAFGGPDKAHASFTPMQKAISYSMTSPFTTGGIRGNKKHYGTFHPRSFNMGISRKVFEKVGGYKITRMGEDLEFSMRIIKAGFKTALIPDAYVYHKRRTSLPQFYKQLHFFGRARINVGRFYEEEVKLFHWFPALFTLGFISLPFWSAVNIYVSMAAYSVYGLFFLINFSSSLAQNKNIHVAVLSIATSFVQLFAYGVGFLTELGRKLVVG